MLLKEVGPASACRSRSSNYEAAAISFKLEDDELLRPLAHELLGPADGDRAVSLFSAGSGGAARRRPGCARGRNSSSLPQSITHTPGSLFTEKIPHPLSSGRHVSCNGA